MALRSLEWSCVSSLLQHTESTGLGLHKYEGELIPNTQKRKSNSTVGSLFNKGPYIFKDILKTVSYKLFFLVLEVKEKMRSILATHPEKPGY